MHARLSCGPNTTLPAQLADGDTSLRRHTWVLSAYLLLGLILTWPLVAHLATHVPGDGIDDPSLAWNLWWVKHTLVDLPQNPFIAAWQFWPIGINLAFYTLTVLNGMLGVPLVSAFGVIPAYNLLLLSSFVLGGFGACLLALDFVGRGNKETRKQGNKDGGERPLSTCLLVYSSAFLAGALYAFASSKLFYAALGQGNIASSQWAPFAALYIVRAARPGGKTRDAALAALFLALQAYAEMTYASFLLVFAGLAFVWGAGTLLRRQRDPAQMLAHPARRVITRYVARFTFLAVLFALAITPLLANMLPDLRAEGDFLTSGGGFADIFSADLAGYATPTQLHPLLGGVIRAWSHDSTPQPDGSYFAVNKGQQIYLGYVALVLAVVGAWRSRRRGETWFWVTSALLFFVLTLGPNLRIAGHDIGIPLPFRLLEVLPFFKGNRYPSRYSVLLMLSVAPLVAAGTYGVLRSAYREASLWDSILTSRQSPARTADHAPRTTRHVLRVTLPVVLLALLLFEHLSVPLPISDLRVPAIYARVAAEPGDFALLELPPGWRNGARVAGKQDVVIMSQLWNQTSHGKRVLGGNTSRNPEFKFQYFSEDPTLARLIALTNAADLPDQHGALREALTASPVTAEDRARARDLAAFLNLRYVMVHRDKLPAATEKALRELLPVELVSEEGNLALYRVTEGLAPPRSYAVGTDQGRMALAEGWSPPAPGAGLADDGSAPPVFAERREARLLLPLRREAGQIRLHGWSFAPDQQVTLVVDGRETDVQLLPEAPTWLTFGFPAGPDRPPLSDVRLRFAQTVPYREWAQRLDGVPVSLLVRSAGQETGDFGHIYADGVERSLNRRGYNLVALSPDGRVLDSANFDTHADPAANTRLAEWVATLSVGTRVAGAARDEASLNLTQEGVDALRSLGVGGDLRGHFRWGHAFIGGKGDVAGTAREVMDGVRPVQLSLGLPLSGAEVAAAVDAIEVR
jgi:hypothetical protein